MCKTIRVLVMCVLVLAMLPISFAVAQGNPPPGIKDGTLTIAWIPKALNNPVFELGRDGCIAAAKELTAKGPYTVECKYMGSVASDMAEEARVMADAVAQGVGAIGVSCNSDAGCVDPINAAVKAGVQVMTWDSDSPKSDRFTYLGVSNYQGGLAAADLLIRTMGPKGKVALLTGVPGAPNLEERIKGFKDYVAKYPDIQIVTTVACDDDINKGVQVVEETMQKNPDLNGWFFVGLWPLLAGKGAMPQWEKAAQAGMKTIAFDTLPQEQDFVKAGLVHGLVGQKYWGWGYDTVNMLYQHVLFGTPYEDWTNSGMDLVSINNVDAMKAAWDNKDFTKPLPPAYPSK
jgi:ribose transport system substrate-binding protein